MTTQNIPASLRPDRAAFQINATHWAVQDDAEQGVEVTTHGYSARGCSCGKAGCWHRDRVQWHLDNAARTVTTASTAKRSAYALNGNAGFSLV